MSAKRIFQKCVNGLHWAFVEPQLERRERYRDYRKESRALDEYSNQQLMDTMDHGQFVRLGDIDELIGKLNGRLDFSFSGHDFETYLKPFFRALERKMDNGEIECRIRIPEKLNQDARIAVGDLLLLMNDFELPDGTDPAHRVQEEIFVPVEQEFDQSTWLGRLRTKAQEVAPLRTPSSDVEMQTEDTERMVNVKRPLILAIGYAAMYRPQNRVIEQDEIPMLRETKWQRQMAENQKAQEPRYYRGHRMN